MDSGLYEEYLLDLTPEQRAWVTELYECNLREKVLQKALYTNRKQLELAWYHMAEATADNNHTKQSSVTRSDVIVDLALFGVVVPSKDRT